MSRRRIHAPWTLAVAALAAAAGATVLSPHSGGRAVLDWALATSDGVRAGEIWRLLTGPLIHANLEHLLRDLPVFVVLGLLYERRFGPSFPFLLVAAFAWPALAVLLASDSPALYMGLSGVDHALLAAALVLEWRARGGSLPGFAWILAAGMVAKCLYEVITGDLLVPLDAGPGARAAPLAHAVGIAVGLGCVPQSRELHHDPAMPGARVEVDEHDLLPGPEQELALGHRYHERGAQ